jgi:hypothetical protein
MSSDILITFEEQYLILILGNRRVLGNQVLGNQEREVLDRGSWQGSVVG